MWLASQGGRRVQRLASADLLASMNLGPLAPSLDADGTKASKPRQNLVASAARYQ